MLHKLFLLSFSWHCSSLYNSFISQYFNFTSVNYTFKQKQTSTIKLYIYNSILDACLSKFLNPKPIISSYFAAAMFVFFSTPTITWIISSNFLNCSRLGLLKLRSVDWDFCPAFAQFRRHVSAQSPLSCIIRSNP